MLKSAQRKANAKGTQHASLFYDERPVGKLEDERKLAAFFAFFCLSVLHTLRLDRTWSLFMMQTGQKYCCRAEAEVDSFLIFSILRILPLRFRTAENTSNFRRNTDKYGRLATLEWMFRADRDSHFATHPYPVGKKDLEQPGWQYYCVQSGKDHHDPTSPVFKEINSFCIHWQTIARRSGLSLEGCDTKPPGHWMCKQPDLAGLSQWRRRFVGQKLWSLQQQHKFNEKNRIRGWYEWSTWGPQWQDSSLNFLQTMDQRSIGYLTYYAKCMVWCWRKYVQVKEENGEEWFGGLFCFRRWG